LLGLLNLVVQERRQTWVLAVDMPEANDLTVGIMALVAQAEREAISRRTKEALAVAEARGVKLGNPIGAAALRRAGKGGAALRAVVVADAKQHAADLAEVVADIRAGGASGLREISEALTARGMLTRRGGSWQVSNVRNLLGRLIDKWGRGNGEWFAFV
jgi:DNA invertase Pin-like site-specific DNA recombinase